MRIALVEDDPAQAGQFEVWMAAAGYVCRVFTDGRAFLQNMRRESYDLIALDWNLPGMDGIEVLTQVRAGGVTVPVLFTTSRDSERDVVAALTAGADDYLIKPLRREETLARLMALQRRARQAETGGDVLRFEPYAIDLRHRRIQRESEAIPLTGREFDLALFLFRHQGQLLSRGHLLEAVWKIHADLSTRTVDTHASNIRRKLALSPANGWKLTSVYQYGYRLERVEDSMRGASES